MNPKTIVVTASSGPNDLSSPPEIESIRARLEAAHPKLTGVSGDLITDLYGLSLAFAMKLAEVDVDPNKFVVNVKTPHKLIHIPDEETGKWKEVKTEVAIIYEIRSASDVSKVFYLGTHVG